VTVAGIICVPGYENTKAMITRCKDDGVQHNICTGGPPCQDVVLVRRDHDLVVLAADAQERQVVGLVQLLDHALRRYPGPLCAGARPVILHVIHMCECVFESRLG